VQKRTKTYSLDDAAIELVHILAGQEPGQNQSGFINKLIYAQAEKATRRDPMYPRIRKLLQEAKL
jgi:hypothetical protein